ncbi:MAG: thiamine phosphate synthase [Desulfuromonadales bacterium]|nr:thiamine phosphate synthase [Desulfuromonadales bacterium]
MTKIDFTLYLITDRQQVPGGDLPRAVACALAGGVRAVQLREKDLLPRDLYLLARELRTLTHRFGARLLINDRIDVALATEADGVHLGGGSLPVAAARRLLGPARLIGVSAHRLEEVDQAARDGADFVTFGPVWFTPSKAAYGAPVGLDALRQACTASPLPVFALGGVNVGRIPELLAAGAAGAACISALLAATDPRGSAADFLQRLENK